MQRGEAAPTRPSVYSIRRAPLPQLPVVPLKPSQHLTLQPAPGVAYTFGNGRDNAIPVAGPKDRALLRLVDDADSKSTDLTLCATTVFPYGIMVPGSRGAILPGDLIHLRGGDRVIFTYCAAPKAVFDVISDDATAEATTTTVADRTELFENRRRFADDAERTALAVLRQRDQDARLSSEKGKKGQVKGKRLRE